MNKLALNFFAGWQHDGDGGGCRPARIKHSSLQVNRRVLAGDMRQVARGRMAGYAATCPVEISFPLRRVPGEQSRERIGVRDSARAHGPVDARVKKSGDIVDLLLGHGKCGHALLRTPVADDLANQVSSHVICDEFRADQIRTTRARGVVTMTEAAVCLELLLPAFDSSRLARG